MSGSGDSEYEALALISARVATEYEGEESAWVGSPFEWIKHRPSRTKGAIGEKIISSWLMAKGFAVARAPDSDADRVINGHRFEVKFSTLWKTGLYKFQQFRDQDYEAVICLGVSPFDAHCWVIPKFEVMSRWQLSQTEKRSIDGVRGQHAEGSETAWLEVSPPQPWGWLSPYGGSLERAAAVLSTLASP